jgi:hypothetical protein
MKLKENVFDVEALEEQIKIFNNKQKDEYAIEFAEWLLKFDNLKNEKEYVIKQLLEIFKKEKGL